MAEATLSSTDRAGGQAITAALAVAATFTADLLQEPLSFWLEELHWPHAIRFAPYNQVFQTLLNPAGTFAGNREGVNILLVRLEDWAANDRSNNERLPAIEDNVRQFVEAVRSAAASQPGRYLVILCPATPAFLEDPPRLLFASRMDDAVRAGLRGVAGVRVTTAQELLDLYPAGDYDDPHANELGHVPYTPVLFAALATLIVRRADEMLRPPFKLVALDCDNTLWQGICGEDGPTGVVVDPAHRALQEFLVQRQQAGLLLALCSKNNEEDVLETFRLHPEMRLTLDHIAARQVNWEPKSSNLLALADELSLGLDSFIFLDDSPKECAEVEANCPEVVSLALPGKAGDVPHFLKHVWAFDMGETTAEDRLRAASYLHKVERDRFARQAANLEEFLAGLELQVQIGPMQPEQLPRVAQLTQRTNQMNVSTIRRTEAELHALLRDGQAECLTVEASDRFGDYGLVGVVLFSTGTDMMTVDTLLLSCRALGRGIEHRMLAAVGGIARERGRAHVEVPFQPTAKNRPARQFLESVGADYAERAENSVRFRFPTHVAAALTYHPGAATPVHDVPDDTPPAAPVRRSVPYARIACKFSRVESVMAAMAARRQAVTPTPAVSTDAPRTALERQLAALWAELFHVPSVGIHDNFFDLGGHSLLAVQLLSRVRQELDVDLSLEVVYAGTLTVAELAKAVELAQLSHLDESQMADLLAELEALSDEEVRALLAAEESRDGES